MQDFEIENGILKKYHGSGGVVRIPEGVISISGAFDDLEHISEIVLPESICQLTLRDFNSKTEAQLKAKFTDKDGFCRIGKFILDYSGDAEEIVIPEGVQRINHCITANSKVKSVVFPKSMKTVFGFVGCPNLEKVQFNEGLQSIGPGAFSRCPKLKDVKIPGTVICVGESAFVGCESFVTNGSFSTVQDVLLKYTGDDPELVVPDNIRLIANKALERSQFRAVQLPKNLEGIGAWAFASCSNLESIQIPHSVKYIGEEAFWRCVALERAELPPVASVPKKMFSMCDKLSQVTLENGTEEICDEAFSLCKALKGIGIPESVRRLGKFRPKNDDLFLAGCFTGSGLEELFLPEGLEEIGARCFDGCDLKKINIPLSLKRIGAAAFTGCRELEHFIVPNSVEELGENLFFNCTNFLNTDNRGQEGPDKSGIPAYDRGKFVIEDKKLIKYVGNEKLVEIPDGVEVIGAQVFNIRTSPQEICFPESLKNIEENDIGWGYGINLVANMPKGYLQQTSKLNTEMVIRMVKAPWRDYVTVDDWTALYLFQTGNKITEFCTPYVEKNPEETVNAMCRLLEEKGKARHFDIAVNFLVNHKSEISDGTYSRLCLVLNQKKATKAMQRLADVWGEKKPEEKQKMPEEKRRDIYCDSEYMKPFLPATKGALKAKSVNIKQNGIEFTVNMKAGSVLKRMIKDFGVHDLCTAMGYLMTREEVVNKYDPNCTSDFFEYATPELRDNTPKLDKESLELRRAFIYDVYCVISDDKVLEEILRAAPKKKDGKLALRKYTRIACAGICTENAEVFEIVAQAEDERTLSITPRKTQLSHVEFEKIKDDFLSNHSSLCRKK